MLRDQLIDAVLLAKDGVYLSERRRAPPAAPAAVAAITVGTVGTLCRLAMQERASMATGRIFLREGDGLVAMSEGDTG